MQSAIAKRDMRFIYTFASNSDKTCYYYEALTFSKYICLVTCELQPGGNKVLLISIP